MSELWGTAAGSRLAEQDIQKSQMMMAELAMMPAKQRMAESHANLYESQAQKAQMDVQKQRLFMANMAQMDAMQADRAAGNVVDPLDRARMMADVMMRSGDPKGAMQVQDRVNMIEYRNIKADTQRVRQADIDLKSQLTRFDMESRLLQGVQTKEQLQRQAQEYERRTGDSTGILQPDGSLNPQLSQVEDSQVPALVESIRQRSMSKKDQMMADERKRRDDSLDREFRSRQANRSFWQQAENIQMRSDAARKPTAVKSGEVSLKGDDRKYGADFLKDQFPDMPAAQSRVLGTEMAERIKNLRKSSPQLSQAQASEKVLGDMVKEGKFLGQKGTGKSPDAALALPPPGKDGKADPAKFKANTWYNTPMGPRFFDGKNVLTPQEFARSLQKPMSDSGDNGDDEETEVGVDAEDNED